MASTCFGDARRPGQPAAKSALALSFEDFRWLFATFFSPTPSTRTLSPMAPLADFILAHVPLPSVPYHLTHYVNGKTPLSTPQEVFPTLVAYLVIIFGTQYFMKDKPPYKLQFLFQVHNVILSAGSLLLVSLILEEVIPMVWGHGVFWGLCSTDMWTDVCFTRQTASAMLRSP